MLINSAHIWMKLFLVPSTEVEDAVFKVLLYFGGFIVN